MSTVRVCRRVAAWSPARYRVIDMYTVRDLADRFGLHPKRVRERLAALAPVIDPHVTDGKQNAKLIDNAGVAIFDRLMQLERQEGFTVEASVQRLQEELSDAEKTTGEQASDEAASSVRDGRDELVSLLKEQLNTVQAERDRLLSIIEDQSQHLHALMPGKEGDWRGTSPVGDSGGMSRWQHLKAAVFGR